MGKKWSRLGRIEKAGRGSITKFNNVGSMSCFKKVRFEKNT